MPPPGYETSYKFFKTSLAVLPEEAIISLSALGASQLYDYKQRSAEGLAEEAYTKVQQAAADPDISALPSTLKYSYSDAKPNYGLYYLWRPDEITSQTRLIIFFHGFGGCFRYYAYFMKKAFPEDVVILPIYGCSAGLIQQSYMYDLMLDLAERGVPKIHRPWLIGLSAGGYAMFEQYSRQPRAFSGGVSLASLCPEKDFPGLSRFMNVLMINGDNEQGITADMLERQHREIAKYVGKFEGVVVPGDHFFLFSSEKEVITLIRNFIDGES